MCGEEELEEGFVGVGVGAVDVIQEAALGVSSAGREEGGGQTGYRRSFVGRP